jgi:SAM-dependent methyltransferase
MTAHITLAPKEKNILDVFSFINKKGGPDIFDYNVLTTCINSIPTLLKQGVINEQELEMIKAQCAFLQDEESIMGYIKAKPLGYAGDYQIIEKIYQKSISPKYFKWDHYALENPAAEAVRNRKQFFKSMIFEKLQKQQHIELLNIASGPARDLKEVYDEIDPSRLKTTCIDIDDRAISYAKRICHRYKDSIKFINQNIFKFQTDQQFDLIWSAGLFDYFNDKTFVQLLKRLEVNLKDAGEMCIGNFSKCNPGRVFMELFGEWFLNHRSEADLVELVKLAGVKLNQVSIDQEPLKVNLFLRIKNKPG